MGGKQNGNGKHHHTVVEWAEIAPGYRRPYIRNHRTGFRFFLDGFASLPDWQDALRAMRADGWQLPDGIEEIIPRHAQLIEAPPGYYDALLGVPSGMKRSKQHKSAPSFAASPFDSEIATEAWDRLAATHPALIEHLNGSAIDPRFRDASIWVSELHAAVVREQIAVVPAMIVGWVAQFPDSPFRHFPEFEPWLDREWGKLIAAAHAAKLEATRPERLHKLLASGTLIDRELPKQVHVLGDLITTTSRTFLVAPSGTGKTMLGFAMAIGAASGRGFLHWKSERPFRVLYIDGEMPLELLQERLRDEIGRAGNKSAIARDNLFVYTVDTVEEIARIDPDLGAIDPLNTDSGQAFVRALCDLLKPDLIVFDNVQSLVAGVQREEETWTPVAALVQWLSSRRIGQLWIDHTARSTGAQYGTSTKSWRFDTVMVLAEEPKHDNDALACGLTFAKARRAKPSNRAEFTAQTIRLTGGVWAAEAVTSAASGRSVLSQQLRQYHRSLIDAIAVMPTRPGETTRATWLDECIRTGLVEAAQDGDSRNVKDRKLNRFRRALQRLREAGVIGVDGERVMDLSQKYR